MKSREEVMKYIARMNEDKRKEWQNDKRGPEDSGVKDALKQCKHLDENMEEATQIYIADAAKRIGKFFQQHNVRYDNDGNILDGGSNIRLNKNDEIMKNINPSLPNADTIAQQIYEQFGYTDKLPTEIEMRVMEQQVQMAREEGKSETEVRELETKLELAKIKTGEYIDGGLPYKFSSDVIAQNLGKETIEQQKDTEGKEKMQETIEKEITQEKENENSQEI